MLKRLAHITQVCAKNLLPTRPAQQIRARYGFLPLREVYHLRYADRDCGRRDTMLEQNVYHALSANKRAIQAEPGAPAARLGSEERCPLHGTGTPAWGVGGGAPVGPREDGKEQSLAHPGRTETDVLRNGTGDPCPWHHRGEV